MLVWNVSGYDVSFLVFLEFMFRRDNGGGGENNFMTPSTYTEGCKDGASKKRRGRLILNGYDRMERKPRLSAQMRESSTLFGQATLANTTRSRSFTGFKCFLRGTWDVQQDLIVAG